MNIKIKYKIKEYFSFFEKVFVKQIQYYFVFKLVLKF